MSIVSFCLKTDPSFRVTSIAHHQNESDDNDEEGRSKTIQKFYTEPLKIFWVVGFLLIVESEKRLMKLVGTKREKQ
jgi:hypothetical protein